MNGAALPQNRGTMEQHPSAKREISRRHATLTQKTTSTVLKSHQAGKVTSSPWHGGDTEKSHQVVEIVQLQKVVVMPNLNFFQAHGLPIRLLQADTT